MVGQAFSPARSSEGRAAPACTGENACATCFQKRSALLVARGLAGDDLPALRIPQLWRADGLVKKRTSQERIMASATCTLERSVK